MKTDTFKTLGEMLEPEKKAIFKPTHETKLGFGQLLKEGIRVHLITAHFDHATVKDSSGNIWHGNIKDLIKINPL